MTKIVKPLEKALLQTHLADFLETWYVASGELVPAFLVATVLFDAIMYQNLTLLNSRGQGHLVALAKVHVSSL